MLRAVLWDLDGTLVDSEPAHAAAVDAALAALCLAPPLGLHRRLLGASEDAAHAAIVAETGARIGFAEWRALKWARYRAMAGRIAPRPETAGLIAALAAAGVPVAVVSNSTRDEVRLGLEAAGVAALLPVAISRDDVARGKPAPDGYLAASARLGVAPAACLVVEDSPTGARAGLAAGMTTLFLPQDPALEPPAGAIRCAGALGPILASLGLPAVAPRPSAAGERPRHDPRAAGERPPRDPAAPGGAR